MSNNNESSIGQWLKEKRVKNQWDTHKMAAMAGMGQSQISKIETGGSSLTMNALISLSWALKIDIEEVAEKTNTPLVIGRQPEIRDKANLPNRLTSYDLEALFFKYFLRQDEKLLTSLTLYFREAYFVASQRRNVDFDDVQKQVRQALMLGQRIPLPKRITMEVLWEHYSENGILTLDDAAAYLVLSRTKASMTLQQLSNATEIAQSILSRIEQGQTERLGLDDIAKIDKVLGAEGRIFSMFWHALEFQLGISRNRFYIYGDAMSPFAWHAYPLADTFVKLARWTELYSSFSWLKSFREQDENLYQNLAELAATDYIDNNNLARLSGKTFDYLQLSLPHLLLGSNDTPDVMGGKFILDQSTVNLWNFVKQEIEKHRLGPDTIALMRENTNCEDYQGMFRAVLQERLKEDEKFRNKLMDTLNWLTDQPQPPTWAAGKGKIEIEKEK